MFFQILTTYIICYFFRKFCHDPKLEQEIANEESYTHTFIDAKGNYTTK